MSSRLSGTSNVRVVVGIVGPNIGTVPAVLMPDRSALYGPSTAPALETRTDIPGVKRTTCPDRAVTTTIALDVGDARKDQPGRRVGEDLRDRAAHADARDRRVDRIVGRVLRPGDETQRATRGGQNHVSGGAVRIVNEAIEHEIRLRAHADAGLVQEQQLRRARLAGAQVFIGNERAARADGLCGRRGNPLQIILDR